MKRTALRLFAISSLLIALAAFAAERPRYGGTLRIDTRETWTDAANPLRPLVFETLTRIGTNGHPQPQLAVSWEAQADGRRWQFVIRRNVRFHDGSPLTPAAVVASLTAGDCAACAWTNIRAVSDSVVFEFAEPRPLFPAELALLQYAIQRTGQIAPGTGPFRIASVASGKLTLVAFDDYWRGRPFLDSIELTDGRSLRDQATDFDLGRADVVEVGAESQRRLQQQRARTWTSQPVELIGLAYRPIVRDPRLRQAIALAIDRASIHTVVMRKQGDISGGLVPNWISGYAFLLPHTRDLPRAQQLRAQLGNVPPLKIAAETNDPVLQLIADRIALNARDAGLLVQTSTREFADMVVMRVNVESTVPAVAFYSLAHTFDTGTIAPPDSIARVYDAERDFISQARFVPLVYEPRTYAIAPRVRDWFATPDGHLRLDQVWMESSTSTGVQP